MNSPLKSLFDFTDTLEFEVAGPIDDAISRLARSISKTPLQATLMNETSETTLVGVVSREQVKLHRVAFMQGNIFKPIFRGHFRNQNGKASLVGSFTMGRSGRFAVGVGLAVSCVAQIIALPLIGTKDGVDNISFFAPLGFGAIALIVAFSGKMLGHKDVRWIEERIEGELNG
jgi:hypothetical protein